MSLPTILQVEDDEHDVFLLQQAFQREGVKAAVHVVEDGQAAVDYLAGTGPFADRLKHPLPTLVLLDLKLPKLDGHEVLTWIRAQPNLRLLTVVMFSSSYLPDDIRRAYEGCANCFLTKPTDFDQLREVAEFIRDWLRHAQWPPVG